MLPIFYAINKFPHLKQYLEKQETACKCKKFKKYKKSTFPTKHALCARSATQLLIFFKLTTHEPLLTVCKICKILTHPNVHGLIFFINTVLHG